MVKISAIVHTSLEKAWDAYTNSEHIQKWNFASPDWHCPYSENDLHVGGRFNPDSALDSLLRIHATSNPLQ